MGRIKLFKQQDIKDCGAACLSMISNYYGLRLPIYKTRNLIKVDNNGANFYGIIEGAKKIGLEAIGLEGNPKEFLEGVQNIELNFPLIARVIIDENIEHYIVIFQVLKDKLLIGDPSNNKLVKWSYNEFFKVWSGQILSFSKLDYFVKGNEIAKAYLKYINMLAINKKLLAKIIFVSLIISGIGLSSAYVFQFIIDNVLTSASSDILVKLDIFCICLGIMYVLQTFLEITRGKILTYLCEKFDLSLIFKSYSHMLNLPLNYFSSRRTGEILSRLLDTVKIRDALSTSVLSLILNLIIILVCGIILIAKSPIIFSALLVLLFFYVLISIVFLKPIKIANQDLMEKNALFSSYFKESIDGIETIKVTNCEKYINNVAEKKVCDYVNSNVTCSLYRINENALTTGLSSIGILVMLWLGTNLVIKGSFTLGEMMMCYSLIGYFITPVKNLIDLQPLLVSSFVSATRLNDIVETTPEIVKLELDLKKLSLNKDIILKNVNFRYGTRKLVLNNVNMLIEKGKKVAIVGKSGCGKTTLAKLLIKLYDTDSGNILFDKYNIQDIPLDFLRNRIAYISQNAYFFTDTIRNNLLLGNNQITNEEFNKAITASTVNEFIEELPRGFDTILEENAYNLSEGQKQRLAIARALLRKPDILIMDEITSNLDSITEKKIKQTITNLAQNTTCIIIAHNLETIKDCDCIYVLDKGQLLEKGTHKTLLSLEGLYYKLWNDQVYNNKI